MDDTEHVQQPRPPLVAREERERNWRSGSQPRQNFSRGDPQPRSGHQNFSRGDPQPRGRGAGSPARGRGAGSPARGRGAGSSARGRGAGSAARGRGAGSPARGGHQSFSRGGQQPLAINPRAAGLRDGPQGGPAPPGPPPPGLTLPPGPPSGLVQQIEQSTTFPKFLRPISEDNKQYNYTILNDLTERGAVRGAVIWKNNDTSRFDVSIICATDIYDIYLLVTVHVGIAGRPPYVMGSPFLAYGDTISQEDVQQLTQLGRYLYERHGKNILHEVAIPLFWIEIIRSIEQHFITSESLPLIQQMRQFKIVAKNNRSSIFLDRVRPGIGQYFIRLLKQLEG